MPRISRQRHNPDSGSLTSPPQKKQPDEPLPTLITGSSVNQSVSTSTAPLQVTSTTSSTDVKHKADYAYFIILGLDAMKEALRHSPDISLTTASEKASSFIFNAFGKSYAPKTFLLHYKQIFGSPVDLTDNMVIFPVRYGNTPSLSDDIAHQLILKFKERTQSTKSGVSPPRIVDFVNICYDLTGLKVPCALMSNFLVQNGFTYSEIIKSKLGSQSHDSDIVLKERIDFLLLKMWWLSFEKSEKAILYIHNESWINERYNPTYDWEDDNLTSKIPPSDQRIAFSSLWSVKHGLLAGYPIDSDMDSIIAYVKADIDEEYDPTFSDLSELFQLADLRTTTGLSVETSNGIVKKIIPDQLDTTWFSFDVYSTSQKDTAVEMDAEKFLWSIEQMIRLLGKTHPTNVTMVIQIDDATYHRVRVGNTLKVDKLVQQLSQELDIVIEILWGTRGHSELSEIEHSWNFIKHLVTKYPQKNMSETKQLVKLCQVLDYVNRYAWRNRIILVMDCYLVNGYFSIPLLSKKYRNKEEIFQKWQNYFRDISTTYSFSSKGFNEFKSKFTSKFVDQLTFSQIQSLL